MIKKACNKANFKIINYHYFYASLVPLRILSKLMNKDNKVNSWNKDNDHMLTKLMKRFLNLDYNICKILNRFSFGLSLFVVLEKK